MPVAIIVALGLKVDCNFYFVVLFLFFTCLKCILPNGSAHTHSIFSLFFPFLITGMEIEPDDNETVTDFRQHFSEELLVNGGVNYTILEEADLRCGGFVVATNLTYDTLKELAADCMLQICQFR